MATTLKLKKPAGSGAPTRAAPRAPVRGAGSGAKKAQTWSSWWAAGLRELSSSNETFHAAATDNS